jgi:copper chaperone CopZ
MARSRCRSLTNLQPRPDVDDVQISLASGEVTVVHAPAQVSPAQIQQAVIRTGFGTAGVNATNGHDPRPDQCG